MKIRQISKHFHEKEKGCDIIDKDFDRSFEKNRVLGNRIKGAFCKIHNKDLCKCGWEWHWHGGTYNLRKN